MDEHNYGHSYENGSTKPPKNHGGVIAVVLCTMIFLCGILSALGIWDRNEPIVVTPLGDVYFSDSDQPGQSTSNPGTSLPPVSSPDPGNQMQVQLNPVPDQVDNVPQAGGLGLQEIYKMNIPSVVPSPVPSPAAAAAAPVWCCLKGAFWSPTPM